MRERMQNRQRAVQRLTERSAIPPRYAKACIDVEAAGQSHAYSVVRGYVEGFDDCLKSGAGLLLFGDIGTGKTHLACALANALMAKMRPVMYCTALEAVMLVKRAWRKDSDWSEFDVYEQFSLPELLIIDEVGVQHGSEFEQMVLSSMIDARSRRCLPIVAVSNWSPDRVMEILGQRAFDRLVGYGGQLIEMRGESLRCSVGEQAGHR